MPKVTPELASGFFFFFYQNKIMKIYKKKPIHEYMCEIRSKNPLMCVCVCVKLTA